MAVSDTRLTDSEYRTLGAIAAYADADGWCYPSQGTLAEIRGVTRQTINRHVRKLKKLEYLNVNHRARSDGGQTSNLMQVRLDWPPEGGVSNLDVTGGVKSRFDRGCKAQGLTGGVKPGFDTNTSEEHHRKKQEGDARAGGNGRNAFWTFPDNLDNAEFVREWGNWMAYVGEKGLDFTETQATLTLQDLSALGLKAASEAVRTSIRRGWKNIHPPDSPSQNGDEVLEAWERVLKLAADNDLPSLEEGPTRAAVKQMGSKRLYEMTDNQRPFMQKEFVKAYGAAINKNS